MREAARIYLQRGYDDCVAKIGSLCQGQCSNPDSIKQTALTLALPVPYRGWFVGVQLARPFCCPLQPRLPFALPRLPDLCQCLVIYLHIQALAWIG
jgi:hypothetical protein